MTDVTDMTDGRLAHLSVAPHAIGVTTWRCSDGAEIDSGGEVRGRSKLANALRRGIQDARDGFACLVFVHPSPGSKKLDPDDDQLLGLYIDQKARFFGERVIEGPVERPPAPEADELPEGAVY